MPETLPDLADLLPSWQLALRSEGKAPGTIKTYTDGVAAFLRWCAATDTPPAITKPAVQGFIGDLLDGGAESATAVARFKGVRQFARWMADEGEIDGDPLVGLKRPAQVRKVVPALSDDQLRALLDACRGKTLKHRRDEAIVRLMAETGMRAAELLGLTVADVDLTRGLAIVRRGKGSKGRVVPFGPQTGAALDRYVRSARRENRLTDHGPLWVGAGGKTFGYHGLDGTLKERAAAAGIANFHAHRLRHTAATRWLRAGGSEQGLMAVAGWSTRAMIDRYTGASAAERAAVESRSLNLGDL
uniref:Phage integrase family protein n=1 Tax=Mycobacterium sp. (strain KMS) TaxID=189918 RepID=A1UIV5_MYCSK